MSTTVQGAIVFQVVDGSWYAQCQPCGWSSDKYERMLSALWCGCIHAANEHGDRAIHLLRGGKPGNRFPIGVVVISARNNAFDVPQVGDERIKLLRLFRHRLLDTKKYVVRVESMSGGRYEITNPDQVDWIWDMAPAPVIDEPQRQARLALLEDDLRRTRARIASLRGQAEEEISREASLIDQIEELKRVTTIESDERARADDQERGGRAEIH